MFTTRVTDRLPSAIELPWLIAVAGVLVLAGPSWSQQPAAEKPDSASTSGPSKKLVRPGPARAPGSKNVRGPDGRGQGREGPGHGPTKGAPGRAVRSVGANGSHGQDDSGQAHPGRTGHQTSAGCHLGHACEHVALTTFALRALLPKGFLPLPHPKHLVGGMVFPQAEIKLLPRLERFDVDFDLPDHFLPEFPPAIFLTTRPDLGDVSQGKVLTVENFQEVFGGILNAKDLEGVRLLVTQFPQQQFNATADRKTSQPHGHAGRGLL